MQMIIDALWRDGLQTRVGLDERTVADYAESMRNGEQFPPVKVFANEIEGAYYLADGFHRVEAALRAGRDTIEADVQSGSFIDALRYALGCNAHHGKRTTNEDKRRAMDMAWENRTELFGGDPSAALLAQTCGVHRNTAQAFIVEHAPAPAPMMPSRPHRDTVQQPGVQQQVAQIVQPQPPVRVGTDGKQYPVRHSRPVQTEMVLVPRDRYGLFIPNGIGQAFGEDVLADVLQTISAARCALRHGIEDGNLQFAAVRQDALLHLDNAYSFVAAAQPHCVCRVCKGAGGGCKACHGRGWQTEEEYKRNPSEFKV